MLKRITLISTVLFVNIVLLASIIIPHHHHEEEVCIVNTHCHADKDAHNDDFDSHEHEADNSGHCTLNQTFIVPSNNGHIERSMTLMLNLSGITIISYQLYIENLEIVSFQHPPDVESFYELIIGQTKGLRAPPVA